MVQREITIYSRSLTEYRAIKVVLSQRSTLISSRLTLANPASQRQVAALAALWKAPTRHA